MGIRISSREPFDERSQGLMRLTAIFPLLTISNGSRSASMASSGLRSTTIRSASSPGRNGPVRPSMARSRGVRQ